MRPLLSFPRDIHTKPAAVDPDTLQNLGPLRPMAGIWEGTKGRDEHPVAGDALYGAPARLKESWGGEFSLPFTPPALRNCGALVIAFDQV